MTHPTDPVAAMREACAKACDDIYCTREMGDPWREASRMCAIVIRALPMPSCATGDDAAHDEGVGRCDDHGREGCIDCEPARDATPAPSRPADGGERTALSLLADARKCVALVNANGYYDVWLARCDRVLANAKRPAAADAGDAVREARERFYEAARAWMEVGNLDAYILESDRLRRAYDAMLAAERPAPATGDAVALVADERRKQVAKGWTPEHDDRHRDGTLAMAASILAADGTDADATMPDYELSWIQSLRERHKGDRIRELTIAAALIVAEIERLQRLAAERAEAELRKREAGA